MSTVTVVATVEADNNPPRVRLDVTDTGTPAITSVNVTRLDPDGRTVPVRTGDGNPLVLTTSGSSRVGLVYDYEMPHGEVVAYGVEGSTISVPVTVPASGVWLVHPGVPALSMRVTVASFGGRSRSVNRGVFYPMGRSAPIVVTGGARRSVDSQLEIRTDTLSELDELYTLLDDASVLRLNVPAELGWGVDTCYISVGDSSEERLMEYAAQPTRYVTLPYTVVDRPAGGSQAERTYVDLLEFPTYAALQAAYPTYLALLSGP